MTEPLAGGKRLWQSFLGRRVITFLVVGVAIGLGMFAVELAFAYGLQAFLLAIGALDANTVRLPYWMSHAGLPVIMGLILGLGTVRAACNAAQIYMQSAVNEELRQRHCSLLLHWALWNESASTPEVVFLYNSSSAAAGKLVSSIQNLAIQATSAAFLAAGLFVMAPLITLAIAAGISPVILGLSYFNRRELEAGAGVVLENAKTNTRLLMSLKNLLFLRVYGTQGREEAAAQESLAATRRHTLAFFRIQAIKYAIPQILGVGLVCLIAIAATSRHGMAPGVLVSYFYLLLRLLILASGINQNTSFLSVYWPETKKFLLWWQANVPEEYGFLKTSAAASSVRAQPLAAPGGWQLSGVRFSYPKAEQPVFEDLELRVASGQALVIVGPSGSGKSTLLSLLLGLLRPQRGQIQLLINGTPEPLEARRPELLSGMGYVGPESFLIEGTIRENLFYGLAGSPRPGDIEDALEKAECGFVKDMPLGLEHRLTEQGEGLSAGQKQRLALARALLRRPTVLILDEATANLDVDTESRLAETLAKLKRKMTLIIVTHRTTLLPMADLVLELGAGKSGRAPVLRGA